MLDYTVPQPGFRGSTTLSGTVSEESHPALFVPKEHARSYTNSGFAAVAAVKFGWC